MQPWRICSTCVSRGASAALPSFALYSSALGSTSRRAPTTCWSRFARSRSAAWTRFDSRTRDPHGVQAALTEFHINRDAKAAANIFNVGLNNLFSNNAAFAAAFLDYMVHLNEDGNTRAVFEKALSGLSDRDAEPIWRQFVTFEAAYGSLDSLRAVETRRQQTLKEGTA